MPVQASMPIRRTRRTDDGIAEWPLMTPPRRRCHRRGQAPRGFGYRDQIDHIAKIIRNRAHLALHFASPGTQRCRREKQVVAAWCKPKIQVVLYGVSRLLTGDNL